MADKDKAKEQLESSRKAGAAVDADYFRKVPGANEALGELLKSDREKAAASKPRDAFDDAVAEAGRKKGYIGSSADHSAGKDSSRQTGTPATHKDGNF